MAERVGSVDGAFQGYDARRALEVVVGGQPEPEEDDRIRDMRAYLESAPDAPDTYEDGARAAGKAILGFLDAHPEARGLPADGQRTYPVLPDGSTDWKHPVVVVDGIADYWKRIDPEGYHAHGAVWGDLTGFMWGWAVNAAKSVVGAPPVPNPALFSIGT